MGFQLAKPQSGPIWLPTERLEYLPTAAPGGGDYQPTDTCNQFIWATSYRHRLYTNSARQRGVAPVNRQTADKIRPADCSARLTASGPITHTLASAM